jgi:ATP-dependent DNA helicase DinG
MNATVEGVLGEGGLLAARLGDAFESRGEQVEVARAVLRAMEEKSVLLCEAGTGVGKSFAYLVPAMLRCLAGETVVVATNTIALQEQLVRKDIPLLREILDPEGSSFDGGEEFENAKIRPVLVKGRGNYVSLRRLRLASQRQDKLFADPAARRSLHVIEDWAATTLDGTLSTLPALERPGVWDKVESDTGNCMGRKCPNHQACFYQRARRTMEKGNLLICNHALFFSDLALRAQDAGFMPEYQHVVLDEAHNAEDVASEHFGVSLTEGRVMHLLTTLYAERSGKGYLPNLTLAAGDAGSVDAAMREVLFAADASRRFFESALELLPRKASAFGGGSGGGEPGSVRYRSPGLLDGELASRMTRLSLTLKALRDVVKSEPDQFELNAYAQRAQMIADAAVTLAEQKLPGCAYWVEAGGESDAGRLRKVSVACAPVEVGPLLKQHLFGRDFGVTLTSATLATRTRREQEMEEHAETAFSHVMARLGCDALAERKVRTMQVGSPFDYASQVELVVDERVDSKTAFSRRVSRREEEWIDLDSPGPAGETPPKREMSYSEKLAACLEEHLRETQGGAFVLFTSFATLNAVARLLRPRLEADGMPVLGQGIDGSREEILARFREDHRSVLLGASSFWQGVDVRGRGLRNVIITKLPFEPPDRPLTEARGELIQQRGGNPFMEDSIPRAVIRFKQGFGRLIRSKDDHGRVVVMDGRVFSARYGRLFLDALPKGVPVRRVR